MRETRYGAEDPGVLSANLTLGGALNEAGNFDGAEPPLRRVLEAYERRLGRDHPETMECVGSSERCC
jgi:hypothetical protein